MTARLFLRVNFAGGRALGPGKIGLLEHVARTGSISAAAREMGMSYRRAWLLIDEMNSTFRHPVTTAQAGGAAGGGARLTAFGETLVARYRAMESTAAAALAETLGALEAELAKTD